MTLFPPSRIRGTLRLWGRCFLELLLSLPLWILVQVYALTGQPGTLWIYLLPLLSLAGVLLSTLCNVRWKQLVCALGIGFAFGFLAGGFESRDSFICIASGGLCAFLGMTAPSRSSNTTTYWSGIALYFVAVLTFGQLPDLQSSVPVLTWSGSICLIVILLSTNSQHLRYSSFAGDEAPLPTGLRRHNRWFVAGFILAAAVLAAGAGKWLGALAWNAARALIGWFLQLFSGSEETPVQSQAPPPAAPVLPAAEATPPGLLAKLLDLSFYLLASLVIGFLVYYGLRWLYRNTGGIWHRVIAALLAMLRREQPQTEPAAYRDEERNVFTWEQAVRGMKDFLNRSLTIGSRRDRWDQTGSNRERARWMYREWLAAKRGKGYEIKRFLTPQETAKDVLDWTARNDKQAQKRGINDPSSQKLIELYEQARYGDQEPTDAEVAALKAELKL
ncbi:hypothetical protein GCM10010912_12250 [Paenibacillus albidus]|uniref:Protein-glutamine gamma-glutamyltransferase-like C-terminal domain-containing protein n=1 Tax=Paenibacillus albidus TaxID=2041023 RepID=A0A917FES6_9BACL|nr:DUF4129 domain-containing protein [Paenibacillus albidus]GGF68739.1 hypothetical protein GCM10010912_12250 [Paenibacillus albidus]